MTVYIKYKDNKPANINMYSAEIGFYYLGEITKPFNDLSDIIFTKEDIIVGYIGTVQEALKILGCELPRSIEIPNELLNFAGRKIWYTTLKDIKQITEPVFIKPAEEHKLFDGHIKDGSALNERITWYINKETKILASEVVEFISEYRNFVLDNELIGSKHYKGDFTKTIDYNIVLKAISIYKSSPVAYSIDFGLTNDGRTLLIECNDSFALGSYGLDSVLYAKMIKARWKELVE